MSNLYQVNSTCLRYVVPFKYSGTFDEAISKVENEKETKANGRRLWERKEATLDGPESELYDYVRNEFRFDSDMEKVSEKKVGCQWIYWRSDEAREKDGQKIKELLFFPDGLKRRKDDEEKEWPLPKGWNITISNMGLSLFRNGLGFIWYELKIPQNTIDSQQLKKFQNVIRELNRGAASLLWEKQKEEPDYGVVIDEKNGYKTYIKPILLGAWINDTISFLNVSYFAERENTYESVIKKSMKALKGINGQVINKGCKVNTVAKLPDKAILFTYASFGNGNKIDLRDYRYELIFHVANGYKDSYHFSDEIGEEIKRPFDNAYWYATQEGAAYLAWPSKDNEEVFNNLIPSKVRTDYFALYLKTLYQSFSLLIYAEKIQKEISAVNEKFPEEPLDQKIEELFREINLFLTKSMATSVSHIHHQSEFYLYLKNQLRIHDDVKSVTAGLNALDMLQREQRHHEEIKQEQESWAAEQRRDIEEQNERSQREKREKKREGKTQAIMGLFAILGISSALVDCFDFIGKFDGKNGEYAGLESSTKIWEVILLIGIGAVGVVAIYFAVKALKDAFSNKD